MMGWWYFETLKLNQSIVLKNILLNRTLIIEEHYYKSFIYLRIPFLLNLLTWYLLIYFHFQNSWVSRNGKKLDFYINTQ